MVDWSKVGGWVKDNAGTGAKLVGSLLTGNVPAAVAMGVSLVSGATGTDDPEQALAQLQQDPEALIRLKELYYQNEADVRRHLQEMTRLQLEDQQKAHQTTQETIRAGDKAESRFVKYTRPGQSWLSLGAAFAYVFSADTVDLMVLSALLTLPWAYAGLRQVGKGVEVMSAASVAKKRG